MSDQLLDILDSVARELDRESELIFPAVSTQEVRRMAATRRRKRALAVAVLLVVVALTVAGIGYLKAVTHNASPDWAGPSSIPPTTSPSATSTASIPTPVASAVATTPAVKPVVASGDVITMLGIGQLTLGMPRSALVDRGVMAPIGGCDVDDPIPTLTAEGIAISSGTDTVDFIYVYTAQHKTQSGAAAGMTMGEVKRIYGDKVSATTVTLQIGDPQGNTRQAYVISSGNTLVFLSDSRAPISASDVVTQIYLLRGASTSVPVEIC